MVDPVASLVVALAMAVLFATAAAGKLADMPAFRTILHEYQLIPARAVAPAAALVVVLEGALAVGWLIPGTRPLAAGASAALLLGYGAAIAINLRRGRTGLDCGCSFGSTPQLSWTLVTRNGVLGALALVAVLPVVSRELAAADYVVAVTASLAAMALYLAAQQLVSNAAGFAAERRAGREG